MPDGYNLFGVSGKIIPLKNNIIKPCADDPEKGSPNQYIRHSVKAHFPFVSRAPAVKHGKRKAESDYDTVPMHLITAYCKRNGRLIEADAESVKKDLCIITHSFLPVIP